MYMEIKEKMQMKNKRISLFLALLFIFLVISNPIDSMAEELKGSGNISGLESKILLMKQDFLYLEEEIRRLKGECA